MVRNIFVWNAHPRAASLSAGLASAYAEGAAAAGAAVERLDLAAMNFDADAFAGYRAMPPLEPDLVAWQDAVRAADHVAWFYPYWWGAMPARAKAVLDRALLPGFGFKYRERGLLWDKLLTGRTGDVMITSDTPPLYDWLVYGRPGRRVVGNQVLGFCGIKPRHIVQIGPVKTAPPEKIAAWLDKARKLGAEAARG